MHKIEDEINRQKGLINTHNTWSTAAIKELAEKVIPLGIMSTLISKPSASIDKLEKKLSEEWELRWVTVQKSMDLLRENNAKLTNTAKELKESPSKQTQLAEDND